MKEFNKNLNGGIAHHTIPVLEEHQYDAAAIHVVLMICEKVPQTYVNRIAKDIINIALRCRSHNIATVFISKVYLQY